MYTGVQTMLYTEHDNILLQICFNWFKFIFDDIEIEIQRDILNNKPMTGIKLNLKNLHWFSFYGDVIFFFFSKSFVCFLLLFQRKWHGKKTTFNVLCFWRLKFFLPIFVKFALQFKKKNPFLLGIKIPMRQFQTFFLRINALCAINFIKKFLSPDTQCIWLYILLINFV